MELLETKEIISVLVNNLFDANFELINSIREEKYEDAAIHRDYIDNMIKNANFLLSNLTGHNHIERLKAKNNEINRHVDKYYLAILLMKMGDEPIDKHIEEEPED